MAETSQTSSVSVDLGLATRILRLIVDDTKRQLNKSIDVDDPAGAIFELWRSQGLRPPFDKMHSKAEIVDSVLQARDIFSLDREEAWDTDSVLGAVELLRKYGLVFEVEMEKERYASSSKLIAIPFGFITLQYLQSRPLKDRVSITEFETILQECHLEHSRHSSVGFTRRIGASVQSSQRLSYLNISLALFLLMYGAVREERALRVQVDTAKSSLDLNAVISREVGRIGQRVLGVDPMGSGNLLDHIQESDKIKRVLDDTNLYIRTQKRVGERVSQYRLYFDLGNEVSNASRFVARLDRVLRSIVASARDRVPSSPDELLVFLREHINTVDTYVKPVHMARLFGDPPSMQYLRLLHERAQWVLREGPEGSEDQECEDGDLAE